MDLTETGENLQVQYGIWKNHHIRNGFVSAILIRKGGCEFQIRDRSLGRMKRVWVP
jgi:hypothetical protein